MIRQKDADRCLECERAIRADEPSFRVQHLWHFVVLSWACAYCVGENHGLDPNADAPTDTCGVCGRRMVILKAVPTEDAFEDAFGQPLIHIEGKPHDHARFVRYCSERCRLKLVAARRREARHAATKPCARCARCREFLPESRRTNARYCNALCRTHALRDRRRAARNPRRRSRSSARGSD